METIISNITHAKSFLAAFGIVWIVFLLYIIRLTQTRRKLIDKIKLLKAAKKIK